MHRKFSTPRNLLFRFLKVRLLYLACRMYAISIGEILLAGVLDLTVVYTDLRIICRAHGTAD